MAVSVPGCRSPRAHRADADRVARDIITEKQVEALGRTEPFTIETPADTLRRRLLLDQQLPDAGVASRSTYDIEPIRQWPDEAYLERPEDADPFMGSAQTGGCLCLTLTDALQIAAHEAREFQSRKESVFEEALQLDLERDAFRATWSGVLRGMYEADFQEDIVVDQEGNTDTQTVLGIERGGVGELSNRFKNGISFAGQLGLDLVSLLTQDRLFSRGVFADVTVTIPLMRGAGEFVVAEPLTQAERDVVYAIYEFERFKRSFAVDVASEYLAVLRQWDSVQNAEDNYRRLIASTRRARRLADAGRLPKIQVDQSRQDELRARSQWVSAKGSYQRQLDSFKLTLGLPADARIELDRGELDALGEAMAELIEGVTSATPEPEAQGMDAPIELVEPGQDLPGRFELDDAEAILVALENRLDLRVSLGRVHDAQRSVAVAADQLRADITLLGSGATGESRSLSGTGLDNANLRPDEGVYSALLTVDLALERTAERNAYRSSLIRFEQAVRNVQQLEDQVKLEVRNGLSRLLEAREGIRIQAEAVRVAERRVASTNLFLEAGRAEIRDLLEAQDALVNAQNALTASLVNYRVNELSLQRDLGRLEVNERGLWRDADPGSQTD
ncbi:MAG: TolC family protein [Phycisphaerae bacterium]